MPIHDEVLRAALRVCRSHGGWRFAPKQVVQLLPHLNPASVRTHVVSRCCVNAPRHHAHTWGYFKRVGHGLYEIVPAYRREHPQLRRPERAVAEATAPYGARGSVPRETIHAVVVRDAGWYTAECMEIAVVSQGRTLDEVADALRDAVALHLEGEDLTVLGIAVSPRLVVQYETSVSGDVPPS